jgi:hypothetical protein
LADIRIAGSVSGGGGGADERGYLRFDHGCHFANRFPRFGGPPRAVRHHPDENVTMGEDDKDCRSGNSVSPPVAAAVIRAQFPTRQRAAA